jgi:2-polyprenyl-6-methoxyphenol hydroxylase-like FAD-dependent oxidoreductase
MAMAGAYVLADELRRAHGDYQLAFQAYQGRLRPEIEQRQLEARKLAGSFVPDSQLAIWLTTAFLKFAFLPGFSSIFLNQIGAASIAL